MNLNTTNNLLIIRLSSLGDILLTTPLVRTIKKLYPKISVDYLIKEQYHDIIKHNPYIDRIFFYSKDEALIQNLKGRAYDIIIDLQNNWRSAKITGKLGVETRKFKKRNLDKFLLVNFKINYLKNAPQIPERYAATLPEIRLDNKGLDLFIPGNIKPGLLFDKKNIGFAPGSRHFTKMWPKEYYIELGNLLIAKKYKVFLFGGKDDREICKEILAGVNGAVDLSNDNNLLQTAADMKGCAALVCNDSGLMHAACAVKVPVLAIFGSTVREFGFTPFYNKNLILENKFLSCRPCSHIGRNSCPKGHFKCMLELTPQIAVENLLSLLKP